MPNIQEQETLTHILEMYLEFRGADAYEQLMKQFDENPEEAENELLDFMEKNFAEIVSKYPQSKNLTSHNA